jgi:DNA-binding response OmpR family regulator/REP element-mobilizing transposase RayT
MGFKILVASPDRSLGEQISQKLREAKFSPLLASSVAEAAFIIQDEKCTIAVLDCHLTDPGADYLAENLHANFDDLRIIFIHSEEEGTESIKINQARDVYLPSPFFIPDLLEVINLWVADKKSSKINSKTSMKVREIPAGLAWLQDVNKAAQYLTRLSLEIDAQVAMIIRDDRIWAYAGQLSKLATEELAQFVGHHWANSDGSDLARFVRLATTDCEYMLYATHLGSGFVLTLCFMSEMPFTKIRAQTAELARRLTDSHLEPINNYLQAHKQKEKSTVTGETDGGNDQQGLAIQDDSDITSDAVSVANDENYVESQQVTLEEQSPNLKFPDEHNLNSMNNQLTASDQNSYTEIPPIEYETSQQKTSVPFENQLGQSDNLGSTSTQDISPVSQKSVQLESGCFGQHDLSYSCVLLPRLPDHILTEGLKDLLKNEISRLCLAFGWRLEQLNIQPKFLHWVVGVTPDVAASTVIQHIREQTSAVLFAESSRYTKENPSGDFWAPGFLVTGGRQSLTESMVRNFVQNTRSRQGIGQDYNKDNNA